MNCELKKYFPDLTEEQAERFAMLETLYPEWNEKINVISRADIGELVVRHVLHSLAIAKFNLLEQSHNILDVGTGGGFPGIPMTSSPALDSKTPVAFRLSQICLRSGLTPL